MLGNLPAVVDGFGFTHVFLQSCTICGKVNVKIILNTSNMQHNKHSCNRKPFASLFTELLTPKGRIAGTLRIGGLGVCYLRAAAGDRSFRIARKANGAK